MTTKKTEATEEKSKGGFKERRKECLTSANKIPTVDIKGKKYSTVNERHRHLLQYFPEARFNEEISQLKKKIDLLELKENMNAKNKSYLELKAQKDVDQVKENQKLKEGNNDNQENSSSNRRKK